PTTKTTTSLFNRGKAQLGFATALAIAAWLACSSAPQNAQAQSTQTPWQNQTLRQLSAVWWEWILGIQVSSSPWFDDTGAKATTGQPYFAAPGGEGSLLFLIGTITVQQTQNGDVVGQVTRTLSVKKGTALF